jgi:hypothetical protein
MEQMLGENCVSQPEYSNTNIIAAICRRGPTCIRPFEGGIAKGLNSKHYGSTARKAAQQDCACASRATRIATREPNRPQYPNPSGADGVSDAIKERYHLDGVSLRPRESPVTVIPASIAPVRVIPDLKLFVTVKVTLPYLDWTALQ